MPEFITAGEGDFFVQTERDTPFQHLTCTGVGDLPLPRGDLSPQYCPDPAQKGKYIIDDFIQGEAGAGSTTLTRPLSSVANWLLEQDCAFMGWVTYACRGNRSSPENYDLGVLLIDMQVSNSRILSPAVSRQPSEETRLLTDAELSYTDRLLVYNLEVATQSLENTAAANAVAFLPKACENRCGPARGLCQEGYLVLDGVLYNSEIKKTHDGGGEWVECVSDPFTYDSGDASDVVLLETATGHRGIVSRGSTLPGIPAEVSYSEDWGVTWTDVFLGTTGGQYINDLFPYRGKIWAACSGGYIYMSDDNGDTWEAQESGVETVQNLRSVCMYSSTVGYAVGNNNAFLYTIDGDEWNARVGPAPAVNLLFVACNDRGHVFVGAADGSLYVSDDSGVTWATRRNFGAGSVDWVAFDEKHQYIGALIYNTPAGVGTLYRSKDGGATWQAPAGQTATWNSGLNRGFICDQNHIFVVGEPHNGTTFVAKAIPAGA